MGSNPVAIIWTMFEPSLSTNLDDNKPNQNSPNIKPNPTGHNTSNCNFDGWKVDVVSTYFAPRNFDGRKIYVDLTYLLQRNLEGQKIGLVSTYFLWCNINGWKIYVILTYYARRNFDWRKIDFISMYSLMQFCWTDVTVKCLFCCFLEDKKNVCSFWYLFLISFWFIKNENRLGVSFESNYVLMYFFKLILFHPEIS